MTTPNPEARPAEEDVCPHCGSVLQLARAIDLERSVLTPNTATSARGRQRRKPADDDAS